MPGRIKWFGRRVREKKPEKALEKMKFPVDLSSLCVIYYMGCDRQQTLF